MGCMPCFASCCGTLCSKLSVRQSALSYTLPCLVQGASWLMTWAWAKHHTWAWTLDILCTPSQTHHSLILTAQRDRNPNAGPACARWQCCSLEPQLRTVF